MPADPSTDVDYKAEQVLITHTRTRIEGCHCGWGMDGSKLAQSHALHVWRELLRAVLPDHDARVAEGLARMLIDHAARERDGSVDQVVMLHAAELVRTHTTPKEDQHGV